MILNQLIKTFLNDNFESVTHLINIIIQELLIV